MHTVDIEWLDELCDGQNRLENVRCRRDACNGELSTQMELMSLTLSCESVLLLVEIEALEMLYVQ